ncbi:AAA family ATPase [Entomobacter blattae]|uniref:Chromosome partition protein Smc n=1 Tax=Entomobacter blattae TaxID=2762277 RepID=A0A7H1NTG5_9PROT|nr:AAA family ATPase [Entomobacter blattae]QNT79075.1 Chromosome partition protein Smc [Entomobacter blattae]
MRVRCVCFLLTILMPPAITKLRLTGFKSFADTATVDILPGLTGIVGPNGCGKSNITEALRWVMGESSARSLRGEGMEDVIFSGTSVRSSRNLAEVSLTIEQATGLAPSPFREASNLEITRRIERNTGSLYTINAQTRRARDVQTLFADMAIGARSSAMVSQGRISHLVSAKPEERRIILEEAAGITGLHARRKEAEQKLQATETNLERTTDQLNQLYTQIESLTEQSAQAKIYRTLSENIRKTEAALFYLQFSQLQKSYTHTKEQLEKSVELYSDLKRTLAHSIEKIHSDETALKNCQTTMEAQREEREKLRIQIEMLAHEEKQAQLAQENLNSQIEQLATSLAVAENHYNDAQTTSSNLQKEYDVLRDQQHHLLHDVKQQEEEGLALQTQGHVLQERLGQCSAALQEGEQTQKHLSENLQATKEKLAQLLAQASELSDERTTLLSKMPTQEALLDAEKKVALLAEQQKTLNTEILKIETEQAPYELRFQQAQKEWERTRQERLSLTSRLEKKRELCEQTRTLLETLKEEQILSKQKLSSLSARNSLQDQIESSTKKLEDIRQTQELYQQDYQLTLKKTEEQKKHQQDFYAEQHNRAALLSHYEKTVQNLEKQLGQLNATLKEFQNSLENPQILGQLTQRRQQIENQYDQLKKEKDKHEALLEDTKTILSQTQSEILTYQAEIERLEAQKKGIQAIWQPAAADLQAKKSYLLLSEHIPVPDGLEAALAIALQQGLEAAYDTTDAPLFWAELPLFSAPPFPSAEIKAFSTLFTFPPTLARAFAFIGLITPTTDILTCLSSLQPGQTLVSKEGGLWRWDGLCIKPGQPSAGALRLAQRHTLTELEKKLKQTAQALHPLLQKVEETTHELACQTSALKALKITMADCEHQLLTHKTQEEAALNRQVIAQTKISTTEQQYHHISQQKADALTALEEAKKAYSSYSDPQNIEEATHYAQSVQDSALATLQAQQKTLHLHELSLQNMRNEYASLQKDITSLKTQIESQNQSFLHKKHELAELEHEVEEIHNQLENLPSDVLLEQQALSYKNQLLENDQKKDQLLKALAATNQDYTQHSTALEALQQQLNVHSSRLSTIEQHFQPLQRSIEDNQTQIALYEDRLSQLPDLTLLRKEKDNAQLAYNEHTKASNAHQKCLSETHTQLQICHTRLPVLQAEIEQWKERLLNAETQKQRLTHQKEHLEKDRDNAFQRPTDEQQTLATLTNALASIEDQVQNNQTTFQNLTLTLQESIASKNLLEHKKQTLRENIIRLESKQDQIKQQLNEITEDLQQKSPALSEEDKKTLSHESENTLKKKLSRLTEDRTALGPVNLRADMECQSIQEEATTLQNDCDDLSAAIAKLRHSLSELNQEGRDKLKNTFTLINRNFQALFTRMFNGGKAYLSLTGNPDPLLAGLEIFVQPPGKKMASLSLLSGGEQALTALSLIFAVFYCTPAPLCVLDEVDAPLDDANIERFCTLLRDMVSETGTRFLIVTHHQLTMANMDRLYGVTMQERGISRVLSVDFAKAMAIID